MPHPFDRYAVFTDLKALTEWSSKPLRKSIRVNTLKTSVDAFKKWAAERGWTLEPVPWCPEGFFVERVDREEALGKDLLHLLGRTYMQEAASMLPAELLAPEPGETILDMSAAPGSKTTQMAAKMRNTGVIVANDVQEKRLWTLKSSLHRCGVTNVIVTKKVGQWFAKNMTERFDRVLIDAPCTAQGTARKDSDALKYSSLENVGKMARLQRELLESAIHACRVGGRIVYSTCTLTPEENEGIIASILSTFGDQVFPLKIGLFEKQGTAENDSQTVQRSLAVSKIFSALRFWPQTFDTEGFFCAVLEKRARTKDPSPLSAVRFQEEELSAARKKAFAATLEESYGTSFLEEKDRLFRRLDQLLLATDEVAAFHLPVQDYAIGLPFARRLEDDRLRVSHDLVTLRGNAATKNVAELSDAQLDTLLEGRDTTCDPSLKGDVILRYSDLAVGTGLAVRGTLKNRLPRWIVRKS
jgi:16S rRNA (cytosine1407-C5)-methyltransferase